MMAADMRRKRRRRFVGSASSTVEALAGAAVLALALLGLGGTAPSELASVCALVIGGASILEALALAAHYREAAHEVRKPRVGVALAATIAAELAAGTAGLVLGALAVAGLGDPLVYGALVVASVGMLVGGLLVARTHEVGGFPLENRAERRTGDAAVAAGTAESMAAGGALVLGVLALAGVGRPLTLALVGFMGLGAGVLLGGAAVAARLGVLAWRAHEVVRASAETRIGEAGWRG